MIAVIVLNFLGDSFLKTRLLRASAYLLASLAIIFAVSIVNAGDSNSFNPTALKADSIGGVPIGSVIPWPSSMPSKNYLESNGQSLSANSYPKLQVILSSTNVPNYENEFLRGPGAGRAVGFKQGDAIRNITGMISSQGLGVNHGGYAYSNGVFRRGNSSLRRSSNNGKSKPELAIHFYASRVRSYSR